MISVIQAGSRVETECPDMYPLTADDGTTKWVISEGGRYYRIGDLKRLMDIGHLYRIKTATVMS